MTQTKEIEAKIGNRPYDTVFFVSDFAVGGNDAYISRVLSKDMVARGILQKLSRGIYYKPKMTRFGPLKPSMWQVVEAIARRDKAEVLPTGFTALNQLGMSTQMPMKLVYLTSGMARTVKIGPQSVVFRHVSPRNFAYKGKLIPMLVQALKALGKENVTEEHKEMIRKLLRQYPEPDTINYDLTLPPRWIKKIFVELKK